MDIAVSVLAQCQHIADTVQGQYWDSAGAVRRLCLDCVMTVQ